MRWGLPPGYVCRWPIVERMNRAAEKINPLLVIVIALLAIIDISCYSALEIGRRHPPRSGVNETVARPATAHPIAVPPAQD